MKRAICLGTALVFSLFSTTSSVCAASPGLFNVRDYGAKGDGKTKDTAALAPPRAAASCACRKACI